MCVKRNFYIEQIKKKILPFTDVFITAKIGYNNDVYVTLSITTTPNRLIHYT